MTVKVIHSCQDCPARHENSEYPDSTCQLAARSIVPMGHYRGGPSPEWCPLRKEPVKLQLVEP